MDYTLDNIVKEFLIEMGDSQMNKYARYYQLAVSGLREFNMNSSGVTRVANLAIKHNDTVDLPLDYLQYTTIGIAGQDGQIYALGRNDSINIHQRFDNCGEPIRNIQSARLNPTLTADIWYGDYGSSYRNGEFMGRLFGTAGGVNPYGDFRVDRAHGVILLSRLFVDNLTNHLNNPDLLNAGSRVTASSVNLRATTIVLEYLADIDLVDGDFQVHPFMIEALKSWIYYKSIQRDRARGNGEKEAARRDYFTAARWTQKRFAHSTIREWLEAFRSGNTASVKF